MKTLFSLLLTVFTLSACTFTETKNKHPDFKVDDTVIENNLRALVICETINVNGTETSKNGKLSSALEIDIVNGADLPSNESASNALAKKIASMFKASLKNPTDFDNFKVLFTIKKTEGNTNSSSYTGFNFKKEEI